ncbi:hypothetical protein BH11PLA2_BH11PLA2_16090 [soil metagenome]
MTLFTHVATDQVAATPVFYAKPGHLFTKKDATLANAREIGKKAGEYHYLTEYPRHYSRSFQLLPPETILELREALRNGAAPNDEQIRLLRRASRAGQVIKLNLYRDIQSFDDKPPTIKEAAAYFQAHFQDGSMRSWITEYYNRKSGKKAVWTVGDSIHANDRRYLNFDLWKNHYKARNRDQYKPQGVRHSDKCPYTRWVAIDVDNHADEPSESQAEWLARYEALHALLVAEKQPYLAQVNPRNGSFQLWMPVKKWPLNRVNAFGSRVVVACPWVREIYPTKSKWGIICPFRADKINLVGQGELPKVKCRTKTWCYDLVAAWRWHRKPVNIDPGTVRKVLAESFAKGTRTATKAMTKAVESGKKISHRKNKRLKSPAPTVRGKFGPLRGRWLELLSDTYLDGVEPPMGSVVSFLTPQLRLFHDGEVVMARSFLRDVVTFLVRKKWTFSDRVENDPNDLLRSLDGICRDRHLGTDKPLTDVDKTRERLNALGFDGSFASLLQALTKRRGSGRLNGVIDREIQENELYTGVLVSLDEIAKADLQDARLLLRRVLNHVAQRHELSYSLLKKFGVALNIRLSNDKLQKVFALLLKTGLIRKIKNYSRSSMWSVGNQYDVTAKVQFVFDHEPRGDEAGGSCSSCNNTISRFSMIDTNHDFSEYAEEVVRLAANKWTATRIRRSMAGK